MRLFRQAQDAARELLARDPELSEPGHLALLDKVRRLFAEHPHRFN